MRMILECFCEMKCDAANMYERKFLNFYEKFQMQQWNYSKYVIAGIR